MQYAYNHDYIKIIIQCNTYYTIFNVTINKSCIRTNGNLILEKKIILSYSY